jgi:hypothetical protein
MHMTAAIQILRISMVGLILLSTGCGREPFRLVPVSGKITYEDGVPIPLDLLAVTFTSQAAPIDAKTHPRPATAPVDRATGTFQSVTTHKFGDGLGQGKHKVTLTMLGGGAVPMSLVPAEYLDPAKTPLEVDTAQLPFELKVRKPKG